MTEKQTLKRCSIPTEFSFAGGAWGEGVCDTYYNVPGSDMSKKDFKINARNKDVASLVKGRKKAASFKNDPMSVKTVGFNRKNNMVVELSCNKLVSMETDVFYEALKHGGIDKDGNLKDKFIVAGVNGRMKLVRNNSNLHKTILAYEAKKTMPRIKTLEYQKGTMYRTASGMYAVYMGYVSTLAYKYDPADKKWNKKHIKKASLWRDVPNWTFEGINNNADLDEIMKKNSLYHYNVRIVTRFVEATPYKTKLENDCVSRVANRSAKETRKSLKEASGNRSYYRRDDSWARYVLETQSKMFNMVLFGLDPRQHERDLIETVK